MNSPAPEPNLIELFVRPLHEAGFRYLIAGSVGAMYYSEPRLTIDIDIPLFLTPKDLPCLATLFQGPEFYCPPEDVVASEIARDCRGHFNIIHIPTGLKADFYPGNRDFTYAWAWENRITEHDSTGPIYIAPVEYIIVWKMIFYKEGKSEKHLRDIHRILETTQVLPHHGFLTECIQTHGLEDVWKLLKLSSKNGVSRGQIF